MFFSLTIVREGYESIEIINMDSETSISDIKFLIKLFTGVPIEKQKIRHHGVDLLVEDLFHYQITESSEIILDLIDH